MFNIVTGPFQPVLESSLVTKIQEFKSADPYLPLAIVVPSEVLRRRLQWLLCAERGLALYDVHFLTFHQLALRLYDERSYGTTQEPFSVFTLVSDFTLRQLLRDILSRGIVDLQSLRPFRQSSGLCAALWSTIRDLNEGMIDPFAVRQGVEEGVFDEHAQDSLRTLFSLHMHLCQETQRLQVGSADDLAQLVIPWVQTSPLLARLGHVFYYGFYDLSQVQLSLFEAVTESVNVTVYLPLVDDLAFAFARRFYDRHLTSGSVFEPSVSRLEESGLSSSHATVKIINAVGAEDELTVTCKEIGNLIEQHGYRFDEIGVVARTLEPYQSLLKRLFEQHRIPYTSSARFPMIQEPVIKLLGQLGSLALNRFPSQDVLDVLRSPYYQVSRLTDRPELIQPELWKDCIQGMGMTRGDEQWRRLSMVEDSEGGEILKQIISGRGSACAEVTRESIQLLNRLAQDLIADCRGLPSHGHVTELTDAYLQLIHKHLLLPGFERDGRKEDPICARDATLAEAIHSLLSQLWQLNGLQEIMTWDAWMDMVLNLIEESSVPLEPSAHQGVRVLDVMAARGLPFRALFVLGLNENVFPRCIREDAFLRDAHRRVLGETFGYKIDEKLSGYDEERLLFTLLQQAARDRLYLSYQRADEAGRVLAPSSFLREFNRSNALGDGVPMFSLPRRFSERLDDPLFRDSLLTGEELGLKLICKGMNPSTLLAQVGREPSVFLGGLSALADLERQTAALGTYDGMLGPIDDYWQDLTFQGISPTALEGYARCPFQYYASHLLHVRAVQNDVPAELQPSVIGTLCHAVLNQVYVQLIHKEWSDGQYSADSAQSLMSQALEDVFVAYAHRYPMSYGVVWQLLKETVGMLVSAEVEASREECLRTGFRPLAVEVDAEGQMELPDSCSWASSFKIYGRVDRVDRHDETEVFRIVDYKFKMSRKKKGEELDLLTSGIRGTFLQPSLYSLMSEYHVRTEGRDIQRPLRAETEGRDIWCPLRAEEVDFVYLAPNRTKIVDRSKFDRASWNTMAGQQLRKTMGDLLTGIKEGNYFIIPGSYCEHCALSTVCRRSHAPTMSRSYRSAPAKQHRDMRKQKINEDGIHEAESVRGEAEGVRGEAKSVRGEAEGVKQRGKA